MSQSELKNQLAILEQFDKALKQAKRVLKDYKGKNFKILKIKSLIDERI